MPTLPVIDHGRCEAKRDCVRVCPYDVFEVRRMDPDDFTALNVLGKVRSTAHRRMTAYVLSARAQRDIEDIWDYTVDHWKARQAETIFGRLSSRSKL